LDELSLRIGEKVVVEKAYDDGWCFGRSLTTGKQGYFPYDCLRSYPSNRTGGKKQRVSSIYGIDEISSSVEIAKIGPDETAYSFSPESSDELSLRVGEKVVVEKAYDDGWCFGRSLTTGKKGYFPYDCLRSYPSNRTGGKKQRVSSIYGIDEVSGGIEIAKIGPDEATYSFAPESSDELSLRVGEKVVVEKAYDDGWCFGKSLTTGRKGYFPYDCLRSYPSNRIGGKKQRVSSIYDVEPEFTPPSPIPSQPKAVPSPAPAPSQAKANTVVYAFEPTHNDEISLRIGDQVVVKQKYDDGWALGVNLSSRLEGLFPLDCVQSAPAKTLPTPSQRMSSIYDTLSNDNSRKVIYNFVPSQGDELALQEGDRVIVTRSFDDGWSYGTNVTTGKEGNFPSDCLEGALVDQSSGNGKPQRMSSIYGGGQSEYNQSDYGNSIYGTPSVYGANNSYYGASGTYSQQQQQQQQNYGSGGNNPYFQ
ncbi:Sorbin and SH3 domain-containing protein 2, partial [Physocladia obscura]